MKDTRLRCALGVLLLVVAACSGDDAESGSPATEPDAPLFVDGLAPTWSAESVDDRIYGVVITLTGGREVGDVVAEIAYPGFDCAGILTITEISADTLRAREKISINPRDLCTSGGFVKLTRESGDTIHYEWYYPSGELSDTATLTAG